MSSLASPLTDVVAVSGERLFVAEWPGAEPPVVFAHGITSSHRAIAATATALAGAVRVVAPDLRGRGNSSKPPTGAYGMQAHARDLLAIMDELGIDRAILAGHSMGAYVATAVTHAAPERVLGLALIDGGVYYRPPGAEDVDPQTVLDALIKPVMDRLRMSFAGVEEYVAFWMAPGYFDDRDPDILDDYFRYDLRRSRDVYVSKCSEAAAAEDWLSMLDGPGVRTRLAEVARPVLAVGAESGPMPGSPSILSGDHAAELRRMLPGAEFIRVPGTTHYTITLSRHGAAATAEALRTFAERFRTT